MSLRAQPELTSKGGVHPPLPYDQSAGYLAEAIDNSLRRLRIERIDLWQLHRPDLLAHPQEVARTLDAAVAAGKIATLGVSTSPLRRLLLSIASSTTSSSPPSQRSARCGSSASPTVNSIR